MNHIDRLIMEVRKATQGNGKGFAIGCVDYDPDTGIYTATPNAWEGVKGSGDRHNGLLPDWWCSDYGTHEAAVNALYRLFNSFGIAEDNSVVYSIDYV